MQKLYPVDDRFLHITKRPSMGIGNHVYVAVMYNPDIQGLQIHQENVETDGARDLLRLAANTLEVKHG